MTATTRPLFVEQDFRNDAPALAQLVRKLSRWAQFAYEKDFVYTPADPKFVRPDVDWSSGGAWPRRSATPSDGEVPISVFPVPDPCSPARALDLHFQVQLASNDDAGTLRVALVASGSVHELPVSYAALGNATSGFLSFALYLPGGPDSVKLSIKTTSGTVTVLGVHGWFHGSSFGVPLALGATSTFQPLSLTHVAAGIPFSTYLTKILGQNANLYTAGRPRPVVAKWLGDWFAVNPNGSRLGFYRLWTSPHVSSMRVWLLTKSTGGGTRTVTARILDGATVLSTADVNVASDTRYAWHSIDLAIPSGAPRILDFEILGTGATGTVYVASVSAWEQSFSLPLAAGDALPGSFPALLDPMSGEPIRDDLLGKIVTAQTYLFARRGRQLVCDCRHTGVGFQRLTASLWTHYDALSGVVTGDNIYGDWGPQLWADYTIEGRRRVKLTSEAAGPLAYHYVALQAVTRGTNAVADQFQRVCGVTFRGPSAVVPSVEAQDQDLSTVLSARADDVAAGSTELVTQQAGTGRVGPAPYPAWSPGQDYPTTFSQPSTYDLGAVFYETP